jgi:hypothetical protein
VLFDGIGGGDDDEQVDYYLSISIPKRSFREISSYEIRLLGDKFSGHSCFTAHSRRRRPVFQLGSSSGFIAISIRPKILFCTFEIISSSSFFSYSLVFTKQPVLMRRKFHMNKKYKIKYIYTDTYIHTHKHTNTYYNVELLKISPKTRTI